MYHEGKQSLEQSSLSYLFVKSSKVNKRLFFSHLMGFILFLCKKSMKIWILLSFLFLKQFTALFGQKSPIQWINNLFTINIDTNFNKKNEWGFSNGYNSGAENLNFTFKNIGEHLTFIDTNIFYRKIIAKPDETVSVALSWYQFNFHDAIWKGKDTIVHILLPFYYEGKIYREKITCKLTFGKSKLIEHDDLDIDLSKKVSEFVYADTAKKNPSLMYTHFFTIKNISKKTIFCSRELVAYNDSQELRIRSQNPYVEILPGESYKVPAKLLMDRKYRFNCVGKIEVFNEDMREEHRCDIISKFEYKKD